MPEVLLPDPDPPFMVHDTFEIKADVFQLGTWLNGRLEQHHFVEDRLLFKCLKQKLQVLQTRADMHRLVHSPDPEGLQDSLWTLLQVYAAEHPHLLQASPEEATLGFLGLHFRRTEPDLEVHLVQEHPLGRKILQHLHTQQGLFRLLDAVALCCQEDLVVLHQQDHSLQAEALSVCFPSGWNPAEKPGQDFAQIHHPVADHDRLVRASDSMSRAILHKGPFVRFSWGLTLSPALNAHPDQPRPIWNPQWEHEPDLLDHIYLRMERQTTLGLPGLKRGIFTIRVYVNSLKERLQKEPELRPRLIKLLRSVKPEVLEYKGMQPFTAAVLHQLESHT
ncbi:heme-dependent oxidative N-demethylase subunit alpha family protein [Deinococcus roseus]|uniref:DUF3445 domain-containing protein n=1 Tax=Deinococcus roseus TaxID=392414 RepID=A0ABQ2D152_9DEIO|nr:heme-dependent oxidative N-demethylase subunit alpha family protein [Deinococcus roseus]GGJ39253.1 hypothetical protein GCM10008938_26630 [Deinococcus roseus]